MNPQRIIWHHSADRSNEHQFEKINKYHKSRGFPKSSLGYFVGYHYLIEPDGTLKKARMDQEIGAHDTGENLNSIGVCLAGDFSFSYPTPAQEKAAASLVAYLHDLWGIPITRIEPHRWDDDTECPGTLLPDNWLIKAYLKEEGKPLTGLFLWLGEHLKLI